MGELDNPVVVAFPLRGEWSVERSPAYRIPSHGTDLLGQRYAYDLVRTDHRPGFHLHPAGTLRWLLIGGRTRDCYGWGQPVHAAFDGVIVQAVDGVAERQWLHLVRESWLAVKTTVGFARRGLDPARLAGNHVIMATAGTYALYAHLAPGSVAVTRGQRVGVGEVLGRVGHTGELDRPAPAFPPDGLARPAAGNRHPVCLRGVPGGTRGAVAARRAWHPPPARAYPLSLIGPGSPGLGAASPLPGRAPPAPRAGRRCSPTADPTQPVAAHHRDRPQ